MHSQFYSLSSGPPSSLSPQQASQRKFIQKRDRTKRPPRGPGQRLQLHPARSEFPEGDAAIRESVLTLLPPRVLRGLLGLLVFLSFDTTALFFFIRERETNAHTRTQPQKKKVQRVYYKRGGPPHHALAPNARARTTSVSRALSSKQHTNDELNEFVRRSSSLDSQQPLDPRQHGVLVRVVGLVLGRYLQYRGYGLVVPLNKVPDLVCNVLGDDDDRNVLALGEAREGRLNLLRRRLCDAMRSNTDIFFWRRRRELGLNFLAMRSRLLVCLLVSTMRKFVFCR